MRYWEYLLWSRKAINGIDSSYWPTFADLRFFAE